MSRATAAPATPVTGTVGRPVPGELDLPLGKRVRLRHLRQRPFDEALAISERVHDMMRAFGA